MRSFLRHRPVVVPRSDSPPPPPPPPDPVHGPSASFGPPRSPDIDFSDRNPDIPNEPFGSNLQNHQAYGDDAAAAHFDRTSHHHFHPTKSTQVSEPLILALRSSPPSNSWPTVSNPNYESLTPQAASHSAKLIPSRSNIRIFQFLEEGGIIHKMPLKATKYEEILVQRGFTTHDEYFVDAPMAKVLQFYSFAAPLAMFSNYEGKSADWFTANGKIPLWFFSFLTNAGDVIEYAGPNRNTILAWNKGIELAAWMAGTMGPKNGIIVCI